MKVSAKILFVILLGFNPVLNAQTERYSIGFTSAYALSDYTYVHYDYYNPNSTYSTDLRSTFNASCEIRRQFRSSGLFLQSGFKWLGYGWKHTHEYSEWNGSSFEDVINVNTTNLSYLTIPLTATYKFQKGLPGLTISSGAQLSFIEFRKWKQDGAVLTTNWNAPDFSLSWYFSLGYEYELSSKWLIGTEIFSNLLPDNVYNFGVGLSARYIFKQTESEK